MNQKLTHDPKRENSPQSTGELNGLCRLPVPIGYIATQT